jgi:anaerobic selenocysteine-containing dehydrogenase
VLAEFNDDGKVIRLSPDREHPSGGIACHKGMSYLDVHNDPDRLNCPLKRANPRTVARGDFTQTDWDCAMADIG